MAHNAVVREQRSSGFTLVELLVVIAIIGTLVGLLPPAVQVARESARRSACVSNIRQVSLGVLGFESAQRRLPSGWADPIPFNLTNGSRRYSYITIVLPYMEEAGLYDQMITWINADNANSAPWAGAHGTIANPLNTPIAALLCPAERTRVVSGMAATSYHCNRGDIPNNAPNNPGDNPKLRRGPFANGTPAGNVDVGAVVKLSHVTDGTSKTVMLGEVILGDGSANYGAGSGAKTGLTTSSAPSQCSDLLGSTGYSTFVPTTFNQLVGWRWSDALNTYTAFYTNVAPNYPRCTAGGTYPGESFFSVPASSYHSGGGANVSMCDGSVRFISNTIDAGDPTVGQSNPGTYAGTSIRGVWGALGTMASNETNVIAD